MKNDVNTQVVLVARPDGIPQAEHFDLREDARPVPADGQFLVHNQYVSVDPAMRGWVSAVANYSEPVAIGAVMRAIGVGEVVRAGADVTAVTYGPIRHDVVGAADDLATERGIEAEVIDLRSLIPYDIDMIVRSVEKTGRLVIIHEASETLGFGAEIAVQVQNRAFGSLEAPIERVCAPDLPYSYRVGDEFFRPNRKRVGAGLVRTAEFAF